MTEEVYMTQREVSRADIFSQISQRKISKTKAAEALGMSFRHLHRLYNEFQANGVSSLVSRKRGKPSNHQLASFLKARILELVTYEKYEGFGPTFMCEKLEQFHQIKVCVETIRILMIRAGVWEANKKKRPVIHQQRKRRARWGELVQVDGSPHAWFEDRGTPCTLIVFIDDATGHTYGKFFPSETTEAYMIVFWEYIEKYGRPQALYSDKHGIFRVNMPGCSKRECLTQFGRAVKELDVGHICANSPQAKGRVERANQTHQDRLVKELRLAGINTIEKGNKFLETYWDKHNEKFSILPEDGRNAHRKMLPEHDLSRIFCHREYRKVSKNLELQYDNVIYQIILEKPSKHLCGAQVTVIKKLGGEISIEYKGKQLPFQIYGEQEYVGKEINSKEIERFLKERETRKIPQNHPWKQKMRKYARS
jgi:hypothetical protein